MPGAGWAGWRAWVPGYSPRLEQKNIGFRFRCLELVGVPKHLDRCLGWQRRKILGFRFRCQELAGLAKVPMHLAR